MSLVPCQASLSSRRVPRRRGRESRQRRAADAALRLQALICAGIEQMAPGPLAN